MQLKKVVHMLLISVSIGILGGCAATPHTGSDDVSVTDGNGGAQTSGVGDEDSSFGHGSEQGISKRTYYFDFDSSDIHEQDKSAISANANYLVSHTGAKIILEGHTDPRGSREYNVALGERRANAVADLMKSDGVKSSQIRVVSYGAERLAIAGHTEDDYKLDRRVVLVYSQK